jgi:ubiquinone/menaquinone biosynthesis C-methylase UbiE
VVAHLTQDDLQNITRFYNERFKQCGNSITANGWKDQASQFLRFEYLIKDFDIQGKTILDVGCGLGDLYQFLTNKFGDNFQYIGIDISSALLTQAKLNYPADNAQFIECDIFTFQEYCSTDIDYAVESGMLSFKVANNEQYAQQVMAKMFQLAKLGCSLNFLSTNVDFQLDKNHHYDPEQVTAWAIKLTSNLTLYDDYPLWEFTVSLLKPQ